MSPQGQDSDEQDETRARIAAEAADYFARSLDGKPSRAEQKLLGPVGERLTGSAKAAADAARDAGTQRLEELGLTRDAGVDTIKSILKGAGDAARTSAQAAIGTVRNKDRD